MTEEKPPILKSWRQIYVLVLLINVLLIIFFVLMRKYYS
jgi:hypothetical protein